MPLLSGNGIDGMTVENHGGQTLRHLIDPAKILGLGVGGFPIGVDYLRCH